MGSIQISQISPVAAALAGGNTVTINGFGFQKGAVAYFGSQLAEKTIVENDTTLKAIVPGTQEPNTVAITVVNPDSSQFTRMGGFTYISMENPNRAMVFGISPLTIIEEDVTEITLSGRNLIEAYEQGLVALRCPSHIDLKISNVVPEKVDESGIESLTFSVYVSASKPLKPNERCAIQVVASRRPEARNDLIVESSKQMFVVLPRQIPVPLAFTPSLSSDKPTMFVVLGRNLEGCTLEFGPGIKTHLQKSNEDALYALVTISNEAKAAEGVPQFSVLDDQGNPTGRYNFSIASSSDLRQSDPIPTETEDNFLFEGAAKQIVEAPGAAFAMDFVGVPDQIFLGPTAENSAIHDLRGDLPTNLTFDSISFEVVIFTYSIHIPIFNRVFLFPKFDGGGAEIGSAIVAAVGELFPVRASGILFAARIDITFHITVMVIITINFPWLYGGFNEFPEQYPNAIGTIITGIIIDIEVIVIISFLNALVKPDGTLRLLFVIGLTIGIDFTISTDGRHLNFVPSFTHTVRFSSILPFTDQLICDGRFQLASDNGQTSFSDGYGGRQSFYFARSAGECCVPWNFNLELVRFRSGQSEQVVQAPFSASMCLTAQPRANLMSIVITSVPPPQGLPPTLTMNISDTALLKALAQPVDEAGNPNGPLQDLRDLGYGVEFFLELPPVLLDPTTLPEGNAFAIQEGQNLIRAAISGRTSSGSVPYAFWFGAVLGFDIIRYLAQDEAPRIIAGILPLQVNPNPDAIKVESGLAYRDENNNLVAAPQFFNQLQPPTVAWKLERYEPFENQREFVTAVKVEIPQNVSLPQTLNFTIRLAELKLFANNDNRATAEAPLGTIFGDERNSRDPKEFFTGRLIEATSTTPITASLTFDTRPAPNQLIELPNLKIQPNVKEADATSTTPKKLVPPGLSVRGKNVLLMVPMRCQTSSNVAVSFPKPELNLVVINDETFEEYLRVFKQVQPLLVTAGNYFRDFARNLYDALRNRGGTSVADVLKTQGEALWGNSNNLVQRANPHLDDRPLYWSRLQGIGAVRAYIRRNNLPLNNDLNKFEWTSRGLDADGSIKFTGVPTNVRKAIITGFDPFGLINGFDPDVGYDRVERSNPSGLLALFYNGQFDVPEQGIVHVRTAIFPVRFADFNNSIVENAVTPSLGSIIMLLTISQNGSANYYDIERWAARNRSDGSDNNNRQGLESVVIPAGSQYLESTLPFEQVITISESLEGPMGLAPFVIDQSFISVGVNNRYRRERRDAIIPLPDDHINGVFRAEPLLQDTAGHQRVADIPTGTSEEGSGGSYLSNEIFYRVALKRNAVRPNLASGHFHVPPTGFDPTPSNGPGARLIRGVRNAFRRFFQRVFRLTGQNSVVFSPTVVNTVGEKPLTVINNSTELLQITTIDVAAPFSVVPPDTNPLPITLAAGASVTLTVKFAPIVLGSQTGRIVLRESSGELLLIVDVSGSGIQSQPAPIISNFSPTVVSWGDSITVTGQYFTTATVVKIGNLVVNYTVESDTQILINTNELAGRISEDYSIADNVREPPNGSGAITGYIKVTTLFGMATSITTVRIIFNYPE